MNANRTLHRFFEDLKNYYIVETTGVLEMKANYRRAASYSAGELSFRVNDCPACVTLYTTKGRVVGIINPLTLNGTSFQPNHVWCEL